jgi:hypothetical protein
VKLSLLSCIFGLMWSCSANSSGGGERSHYELRFRDAIPLEDENGEIQRSWEMGGDE